jgi:hypothetical protein
MLLMQFIMDCCICYILTPLFSQNKPITVELLIEKVKVVYSVLRYEFIEKLKQKPIDVSVLDRLDAYLQFQEINIQDGTITKAARVINKK